jgi:hypothetical protein
MSDLPVYFEDSLTLEQVEDLATGRALLMIDIDATRTPWDLALDHDERKAYETARSRGWAEFTTHAHDWDYVPPQRIWRYYCELTNKPHAFVSPAGGRGKAVLVYVAIRRTGLVLPEGSEGRLLPLLAPYLDRRYGTPILSPDLVRCHFRPKELDRARELMGPLVDLVQELAASK